MLIFSWTAWNVAHIAGHGVSVAEAEYIVKHARPPFPRKLGGDKLLVWGQTADGRFLQVIFVYPADEDIDLDSLSIADLIEFSDGKGRVVFVIHSMDLDDDQKSQYRKK